MINNHGKIHNTLSIERMELESLMLAAMIVYLTVARKESRHVYVRDDYKERDDANYIRHALYFSDGDRLDYRSVQDKLLTVENFPPKKRIY